MRIKIGDACEFINGGSWTESDYRDNGLPVLKVSNFNTSGFTINDISYLNFELGNKYEKNKLELNDIIIATVGSHPSLVNSAAGRTIRVNSNVVNYYLNQNAICLRVKEYEIIDQIYLYYLTETTVFRNFIQQRGKGAANQMRIPISGIKDFSWDFPPLETQKKIASILSGYDDLIENNLKRIKILEEMAQQTYEEWFVRMRFPGHDASRASASLNPETGLPEGWKQCRMGEILNFTNGFAFKSKDYVENGVYSIVTIKNVQEGYFENSKFDKILEIPSKVKESQRLKTGDLVMSLTGNVGRLCFVYGENLLLNQRVCKIDSKAIGFVYCTLRSSYFKNKIENLANGAAQQNLSTIDMENLIIDFPKNELIDDFESFVNPIFNSILNLNIQNQRLREARDILLPRLMMGMIEV